MKLLFPLVLLLAVVSAGPGYAREAVPPVKKDCTLCHVAYAVGAKIVLKTPVSELCLECHGDRIEPGHHVVDVVPAMPVTEGFKLDKAGRMTCITCHDPHGKAGFVRMLRDSPTRICVHCHNK